MTLDIEYLRVDNYNEKPVRVRPETPPDIVFKVELNNLSRATQHWQSRFLAPPFRCVRGCLKGASPSFPLKQLLCVKLPYQVLTVTAQECHTSGNHRGDRPDPGGSRGRGSVVNILQVGG